MYFTCTNTSLGSINTGGGGVPMFPNCNWHWELLPASIHWHTKSLNGPTLLPTPTPYHLPPPPKKANSEIKFWIETNDKLLDCHCAVKPFWRKELLISSAGKNAPSNHSFVIGQQLPNCWWYVWCYIVVSFVLFRKKQNKVASCRGENAESRNLLLDHPALSLQEWVQWTSTVVATECHLDPQRAQFLLDRILYFVSCCALCGTRRHSLPTTVDVHCTHVVTETAQGGLALLPSTYTSIILFLYLRMPVASEGQKTFDTFNAWYHSNHRSTSINGFTVERSIKWM